MNRLLVLAGLMLLVLLPQARAQGPDEQYLGIYNLIQDGDTLGSSGQPAEALAKYLEAQSALQQFRKEYPDWNDKIVNFRLDYLASKIAGLSAKAPPAKTSASVEPAKAAAPPPNAPPAATGELENRLSLLQDQVRQLQAERMVLQAKLKEALAAQPASVDPRELASAEAQIKSLAKENDLLKVTLAQNPARGAVPANRRALEQTKQALAEANRQLAEQTGKANTLALEKQELQKKLDSLIPSSWNAKNVDATKKALEAANRKLAEQTALTAKLAQDKETLQSRVKTLDSQAQTAAALRAENEVLKKQLAEAKSVSPAAGKAGDVNRQLADAQAQIAALQSDKEILRLETITLEDRVKQLSTPPAATAASTPARTEDAARVKQLERERDDLQKKLDAAQKELAGRKNTKNAAKADELAGQLNALRAQLDVFEAQAVPYTAEELALFKTPDPPLAAPDREAHKGSGNALPPGAATLVADAHRDFAAKRFDQAEEKYQRVLRLDGKNVAALADLAMIQLQMNHLDAAEKNARQALVLAPDDAYSLSILGCVRYEQGKYDDALDILSRAARLDPQNPEIQNYLGLTLNQKGLRSPAETALRKAIQLDPNYASAHNNLAVIYLTQKPPLVELARWHYEKALAAGLPRNPELEKLLDQNKTAGAGR